jgi:hypothetical protein
VDREDAYKNPRSTGQCKIVECFCSHDLAIVKKMRNLGCPAGQPKFVVNSVSIAGLNSDCFRGRSKQMETLNEQDLGLVKIIQHSPFN